MHVLEDCEEEYIQTQVEKAPNLHTKYIKKG